MKIEELKKMKPEELMMLCNLDEVLRELTPYEPSRNKGVTATLLKQWLDSEDTWEEFPVTKKEMFKTHKKIFGVLPSVSLPTLQLFNNLIETGVLA